MRCGRISVKGEAEEIAVSPRTRSRQKHGKISNPFSTSGLDKFQSVNAELSAKRKYIANKTGVTEDMVKFVSSKKGWVPVVIGARDQGTEKKNNGEDASGILFLGPRELNNGERGWESRKKDAANGINGESEKRDSSNGIFRRFVSVDNCHGTPVMGSDSFYMKTRTAVTYDDSVRALTVMISMLFCFVFYGRLCVILFTCALLYLVPMSREGSENRALIRINNNGSMGHLQASETREMVDHGWIGKEKV